MSARLLCTLLTDPSRATNLPPDQWTSVLTIAKAERLAGTLAHRLAGLALPTSVQSTLDSARLNADTGRTQALWEVEMARRALAPLNVPVILLKGSAFAAAGLDAAQGRQIGDLDILVPRNRLDKVEAALLTVGWEWVKPDAYDDMYYRRWMHELPPLIHRDRDRMIDVHHTILPLTARPRPDAAALIAGAVSLTPIRGAEPVEGRPVSEPIEEQLTVLRQAQDDEFASLRILSPADMIIHAAAHLFADGELDGGLRNLWDIDRLVREFNDGGAFWEALQARATHHQLGKAVNRALRLSNALYSTPVPKAKHQTLIDRAFVARLLTRNGWGQNTHRALRLAFTVRGHLLRMPLPMLLRHLWIKWRKSGANQN